MLRPGARRGRQNRFRGGLVKGVRFPNPGCLPSSDAHAQPAHAEARTNREAVHSARRSRDEDRRASMNRPPLSTGEPCARARGHARGQAPVHALLCIDQAFDPVVSRWRASLSPRAFYRLLQYDDARAPTASSFVPRAAGEVTTSPPPSPSSAPSRGRHGLTSHARVLPKKPRAADRADSSEGSRRLSTGEPLLEPVPHTSFVVRALLRRGGTSRAFCSHRVTRSARTGASHARPPVPARPAKGRCVPTKTEVRSAALRLHETRGSLPALAQVGLSSTRHLCVPKSADALQLGEPAPFRPPVVPGVTSQAPVAAQSNGTRGWLLPLPNPSIAAPKDGFRDRRCPRRDVPRTS